MLPVQASQCVLVCSVGLDVASQTDFAPTTQQSPATEYPSWFVEYQQQVNSSLAKIAKVVTEQGKVIKEHGRLIEQMTREIRRLEGTCQELDRAQMGSSLQFSPGKHATAPAA